VRLCLVHGFTQTGASWDPVASRLRDAGHEVITPDVAGHGAASGVRADAWEAAAQLADAVGPAAWVGYSMGGRIVLHLALARATEVRGLVLVSTTAGISDAGERAARREADAALAESVERDGVPAFVERWLEGPMWATLPRDAAGVEARLANSAAGLASSLRLAGTGAQEPLWDRLAAITAPALVITGELDAKFGAVGAHLARALPHASHTILPGAGHAVPWEQPGVFAATVDEWLRQ